MKKKTVIGVTGGFGTGKSTVARIFKSLGALLIDADRIAHEVILPGNAAYKKVISLFGAGILKRDKRIDRRRLARIVFADKKRRRLLNSVVHPEVIRIAGAIIKRRRPSSGVFVIDAPLLIEAGMSKAVDILVVVTVDQKTQVKRCMARWHLSRRDIHKRIRSQMPLSRKRRLADFIIDNNGTLTLTRKGVKEIWKKIRK